jgi:hypothetical protein
MYSLKYEMMVEILQHLGYSGEIRSNIPSQTALKEGGQGVLFVQKGSVVSCLIFGKDGRRLYHDAQAQHLLHSIGIVDWQLVPPTEAQTISPVPPPPTTLEAIEQDLIPQQRLPDSQALMPTWSILERSVFSLADGTRTIEQIAMLLSRPTRTIVQVIYKLDESGVITWRRY